MKHYLLFFIALVVVVAGSGLTLYKKDNEALAPFPVFYQGRFRPAQVYSSLWLESKKNANLAPISAPFFTEKENSPLSALFLLHLKKNGSSTYREMENRSHLTNEELIKKVDLWKSQGLSAEVIEGKYRTLFPLNRRIYESSQAFLALPNRYNLSDWAPLAALDLLVYSSKSHSLAAIENFTPYSDELFETIRSHYQLFAKAINSSEPSLAFTHLKELSNLLYKAYSENLAGKPYRFAKESSLAFPSKRQLLAEQLYYEYPLIEIALLLYGICASLALAAVIKKSKTIYLAASRLFIFAFLWHTLILAMRCYILGRPPVTNMFETVVYVPWIASFATLLLWLISSYDKKTIQNFPLHQSYAILGSSTTASLILFLALPLNSSMENVQAVLNSHYWLIIHVLMIVGSYGFFALSSIFGHFSLVRYLLYRETIQHNLTRLILQTMWLGIALLIPGTILGGVWAAQSWGRFWDWDPKESWAFITACIYLIAIHAYKFKHIGQLGLAGASVAGMVAVAFTWYGVNYILGTGLHSYGFGNGGEPLFYSFCAAELLFLAFIALFKKYQTAG